jgi:signal transduction histidine kinase
LLVNDLLIISGLNSGDVGLERSEFFVVEAIHQAVSKMQAEIDSKDLQILISGEPGNVVAHADRSRVIQIVGNLLDNAIKYSPRGTSIGIQMVPDPDRHLVQINVSDEGPGVVAGDKDKLFQNFFRAYNSSTRSTAGTGLGLAIAKALVELQGGDIWVQSQPGEGSTFSFTLPQTSANLTVEQD